jgi:hypothetical protein
MGLYFGPLKQAANGHGDVRPSLKCCKLVSWALLCISLEKISSRPLSSMQTNFTRNLPRMNSTSKVNCANSSGSSLYLSLIRLYI